ncbi:MAG: HD domain-containing protein [bacterium]|nr:HD domain-containing protein [bacterium]
MEALEKLLAVIEEVAKGNYSNDIMHLTTDEQPETVRRIAEAMGMMMVKVEAREYHLEMLVEELKNLNDTIKQNTINVVSSLANALAARDTYTEGHTARVSELAATLARQMGMDKEEIEFVRLAGILHDIGKIGFPDALFQAHGDKNPNELVKEIMKHPKTGAEILKDLDFLGPALEYVHCHHERPDGKGYPRGLHDPDIPLGAKILAVADSYDAMTTDRPYQKGMTQDVALEILQKHFGSKWDSACVKTLEKLLARE